MMITDDDTAKSGYAYYSFIMVETDYIQKKGINVKIKGIYLAYLCDSININNSLQPTE